MRLLFVNHVHPGTGLVGAVRLQRFAEELTKRGHQVLLLCAARTGEGEPDTAASFARRVAGHDWTTPLLMGVRDTSHAHRALSTRSAQRIAHRIGTGVTLAVHGGPFWRWRHAARAFSESIHQIFAPELAYATFGNLDALGIARDYAHQFRIPWVMDIKDPASVFVPKLLAGWLMRPYHDAAAVTLNAEFQRSHNQGWADDASKVIYSGVEAPPATSRSFDRTQVAMIGSIYTDAAAATLLRGFAAWRAQAQPNATLHYFGVDGVRVAAVARAADIDDALIIEGQVNRCDMLERCTRMTALMYVAHPLHSFHHKLLELAALGRPLITSPVGGAEADTLTMRFRIHRTEVMTTEAGRDALAEAAEAATANMDELISEMSWTSAATRLEPVFELALAAHAAKGGRA